jgi:RHS repeat-associated protein
MNENNWKSKYYKDHIKALLLEQQQAFWQRTAQQWYKPWGEMPTDFSFTGQRDSGWGLYFYRARWYDSNLGRFSQADTIIPNPYYAPAYDRYAYVYNSVTRLTDPTGRRCAEAEECKRL